MILLHPQVREDVLVGSAATLLVLDTPTLEVPLSPPREVPTLLFQPRMDTPTRSGPPEQDPRDVDHHRERPDINNLRRPKAAYVNRAWKIATRWW
eukprot:IDg8785t1